MRDLLMSDELRTKAEMLVDSYEYMRVAFPGLVADSDTDSLAASIDIARAYLAEHPVDDDEPTDEKWIKRIARTVCNNSYVIDKINKRFYIRFDCSPTEEGYKGAMVLIHPVADQLERGIEIHFDATRGDVRRLCKALGIELKETPR